MKSSYLSYIFLLFLLSQACSQAESDQKVLTKGEAIPVQVTELEKTDFSSPIAASGTFSTKNETNLSFKIGGIVSDIRVEEGQKVRKGQLLASLNMTEIQAGLSQARLKLEKAERDFARAEKLYQDSVATLEQFQNATTALQVAREEVTAVEFNVSYAQIRANQDGYVLRKFVNVGQQVPSASPVLQINGTNSDNWILKVTVNDRNWSRIEAGDSVVVEIDTYPTQIPGKVITKSQVADPITGAFWVEISLSDPTGLPLASGLFGRATVFPAKQSTGWQIPYAAILDAEGGKAFVFVPEDKITAKRIQVSLGDLSQNSVQVTAGLEAYQQIIVTGSAYLTDGSTIEIQNK
ncbi:efflux RND transporter periplasmic adaptor subunit [Algoriphagus namhaensis]